MRKILPEQLSFNTTSLGTFADQRDYKELSYVEKKIVQKTGVHPSEARRIAPFLNWKID